MCTYKNGKNIYASKAITHSSLRFLLLEFPSSTLPFFFTERSKTPSSARKNEKKNPASLDYIAYYNSYIKKIMLSEEKYIL